MYEVYPNDNPAGQIFLPAGDLNGDLSSNTTPRVGQLTGVAGVVRVLSGAALALGAAGANLPTTGLIRTANNTVALTARNAANTADIAIASTDNANNLYLGTTSTAGSPAANVYVIAQSAVVLAYVGTTAVIISGGIVKIQTGVVLGLAGTVASTGEMRAANNTNILVARNAANSADIACLAVNSSNELLVGLSLASGSRPGTIYLDPTSNIINRINGTAKLTIDSAAVTAGANVQFVVTTASSGIKMGSGATAPTITAGAGAPAAAEQDGSLYLRTDGVVGVSPSLYQRIGGAWVGNT